MGDVGLESPLSQCERFYALQLDRVVQRLVPRRPGIPRLMGSKRKGGVGHRFSYRQGPDRGHDLVPHVVQQHPLQHRDRDQ